MKTLLTTLLLLTFVGCSSTPKVKKKVEVDDVESEDFKKEKEVRYDDAKDSFAKIDKKSTEALNDESIQRLEDPSDIEVKSILDEIIVKCYNKDFEDAFALIQANHDKYKQHPIFWNQVGTCFMLQGNRRKALLFYNKALEYKTSYAPAYNNLGVMYRQETQDPKSLVAYTRSKKSNNLAKTPRFNLAQLYLEYGLYNQAISMLKGLSHISDNDVEVKAGLATAYLMKGDLKQALSHFEKIDDDFWEQPHIGINYSLASFLNGNKEKALDIFDDVNIEKLGEWNAYHKEIAKRIGVK